MDIDFFLLFLACNVLNHFLCAIAQTRTLASTARGLKVKAGGGGIRIRSGKENPATTSRWCWERAPILGSFLHNGIHIKNDIIFTLRGPNGWYLCLWNMSLTEPYRVYEDKPWGGDTASEQRKQSWKNFFPKQPISKICFNTQPKV